MILRKNKDEYGSSDPILVIAGVAITIILLLGGSFAMTGMIQNARGAIGKEDVQAIKTAIDTGLVLQPTAEKVELVKTSDDKDEYAIYVWNEGDKEAYESKPFNLSSDYVVLEGTTRDYTVTFSDESLFSSQKYIQETAQLPGGIEFSRSVLKEEDMSGLQVYSSIKSEFVD